MNTHRILTVALTLLAITASGCAMERDIASGATGELSTRPYFDVFRGEGGDHYFNLRAANHEIILQSQGYSSRTAALNGFLSVLDNGELYGRYEVRPANDGTWYFVLESRNGRVIGISETYVSRSNAERGVSTVVRNVGNYLDWQANRTGARFDVFRGTDGRYYFNLHAANGEIVLVSQGYSSEESAYNGTFSVADNGIFETNYDLNDSADGGAYFTLQARNGQTIGVSETYSTRSNARRGCDSVIALLPDVDLL